MSPLVEQMLNATHARDLELVEIEDLFAKDCECAADHIATGTSCTGKVVARKTTDCEGLDFLICSASYKWNLHAMSNPSLLCEGCDKDLARCWTIRPI